MVTLTKLTNFLEIYSRIGMETLQHSPALMSRFCTAPTMLPALTSKYKVVLLPKKYIVLETERLQLQEKDIFTRRMWFYYPGTWAYLLLTFARGSSWTQLKKTALTDIVLRSWLETMVSKLDIISQFLRQYVSKKEIMKFSLKLLGFTEK